MASKTRDFGSLEADLAKVAAIPAAEPEKKGPGRPETDTVQFTLRVSRSLRAKLTKMAAKEQDETEQNVTAQQVAVRLLEAAVNG